MIFSDSKIFNNVEHQAASLQQLSLTKLLTHFTSAMIP